MKTYKIKECSIPLDDSWDVIVLGGGPSGCTAAAAAAREGARTLLVEAAGCLGGMGTSGLVPAWCPFTDKEKIIYAGLAEKIFLESIAEIQANPKGNIHGHIPIDPEKLKRIYDELVTGSGASLLLHTRLSAAEMGDDGTVEAVILSKKEGLAAYKAGVYVDCTGDADLVAFAGGAFAVGGHELGDPMPSSLCYIVSNVDSYAYHFGPKMFVWYPTGESPMWDILKSGRYPEIVDSGLCPNLIGPGTVGFNATHVYDVDATNTESVTKAMISGRKSAAALRDALAEFHPRAFANSFLASTANLLGVRESRRIIGDYILNIDDYVARRSFEDEIGRNCYIIDNHLNVEKNGRFTSYEEGVHQVFSYINQYGRYEAGESHGIPYRCLTPVNLKNVIAAGRSISCDQLVQKSIRVMPPCLTTGEAAGMAAAHAADRYNGDVHAVDTAVLRKRLREEGAYLP